MNYFLLIVEPSNPYQMQILEADIKYYLENYVLKHHIPRFVEYPRALLENDQFIYFMRKFINERQLRFISYNLLKEHSYLDMATGIMELDKEDFRVYGKMTLLQINFIANETVTVADLKEYGYDLSCPEVASYLCKKITFKDIITYKSELVIDMFGLSSNPNIPLSAYYDGTFDDFRKSNTHIHWLNISYSHQIPYQELMKLPLEEPIPFQYSAYFTANDIFQNLQFFDFNYINDSKIIWTKDYLKYIHLGKFVVNLNDFQLVDFEAIERRFNGDFKKNYLAYGLQYDEKTRILTLSSVPFGLLRLIEISDLLTSKPVVEKKICSGMLQKIVWDYELTEMGKGLVECGSKWTWNVISSSDKITLIDIKLYPLPWDYKHTMQNPNISLGYFDNNETTYISNPFTWHFANSKKVVTFQRYFRKIQPYLYAPPGICEDLPRGGPFYLCALDRFNKLL